MTALAHRTYGTTGSPVAFLHGLLGQGKNLATAAAGLAARGHVVTTYDLPGHGQSPWVDHLDYAVLADAVAGALPGPGAVLGHSMGGKTAMQLALVRPDLVTALAVVDIAPVDYPRGDGEGEHERHLRVMRALDLGALTSRADADAALAVEVHDARVRGFLLQNLARSDSGWTWRADLDVLARDLPRLSGFPAHTGSYDGPVLLLAGGDSDYVLDEHRERISALFPQARVVRVKGAGHWVHAEQPELVVEAVARFLDSASEAAP